MSVQQVLTDAAPPALPLHRRVSTRRLTVVLFVALILAGSMFLLLGSRSESTTGPRSGSADAPLAVAEPPAVAPLPEPPPPSREMLIDERLSRIDRLTPPGLHLTGAAYRGAGLAACTTGAVATATSIQGAPT